MLVALKSATSKLHLLPFLLLCQVNLRLVLLHVMVHTVD